MNSVAVQDKGSVLAMDDAARNLLVSIHSHFAELILTGVKSVELRRRFDPTAVGGRMLIYATSPTAAVIGYTRIEEVEWLPVDAIWARYNSHAAISFPNFRRYFEGADKGFAIHVAEPTRYINPISLTDMRNKHGLRAPQSYMLLRDIHRELIEHEQD